jgi:hypothetical protein
MPIFLGQVIANNYEYLWASIHNIKSQDIRDCSGEC